MGLYVELSCDVLGANCESHESANPQGRSAVQARAEGRRCGWKVGPGNKAVCPRCRAALQSKDTHHD